MTLQQMAEIAEKAGGEAWTAAPLGKYKWFVQSDGVFGRQDVCELYNQNKETNAAHIAACSPSNIIAAAAEERRLVARVAELEAENARLRQSHIWRVGDYVTPRRRLAGGNSHHMTVKPGDALRINTITGVGGCLLRVERTIPNGKEWGMWARSCFELRSITGDA